jgi:predicted short-subunit dehydrogenase-like oxidoreductase (DUF2520 family)
LALGAGLPSAAATLSGVVMANGRAVESAVVSIYVDGPGSRKFVTITNRSGAYRFANVMNSRHIVIVEKDGRRIYQGAINVKTGEAQFDVKL